MSIQDFFASLRDRVRALLPARARTGSVTPAVTTKPRTAVTVVRRPRIGSRKQRINARLPYDIRTGRVEVHLPGIHIPSRDVIIRPQLGGPKVIR